MRAIKKLCLLTLALFAALYTQAQSGMMDPVSFKLKNGMTVIVAQNQQAAKVYSKFTVEGADLNQQHAAGANAILQVLLHQNAAPVSANVSFNEKGGLVNADAADFANSLNTLSKTVQGVQISQELFEKAKASLIADLKVRGQEAASVSLTEVESVNLKDVKAFYTAYSSPSKAYLTIAGNISSSAAKAMAQKAFGDWKENELSK